MGYTHYYSETVKRKDSTSVETFDTYIGIINDSYREFLSAIKDPISWWDLQLIYDNRDEDEETFDRCFHEYWWWHDNIIQLLNKDDESFQFCKTARKIYDVAVVLSLQLSASVWQWDWSSDSDNALLPIQEYCENELEDYEYDFSRLIEIYERRSNQLQELDFEDNIEEEKPYSCYADIPEADLEFIWEQIKTWVTSIQLTTWQWIEITLVE